MAMKQLTTICIAALAAACGSSGTNPNTDPPDADTSTPTADAPTSDALDQPGIDASTVAATNDRCANALPINMATMHVDIGATTVGAGADLAAPCGTASRPDVFFAFTLTRRQLVYADTFGATGSSSLYFASSCTTPLTATTTPGDAVCSEGACGTPQAQIVALLEPGTYYLVYAGTGPATIHFQHVEVGMGTVTSLARGATTSTGTTSGVGTMYQCDAGGPENAYWWRTCPSDAGGTFVASTCTGTTFDTILSLQVPATEAVMCDDDTCSFQSTVSAAIPAGAGLYSVAVDGFSPAKHGAYTLTTNRP